MLKPLSVSTEQVRQSGPVSPELAQRVFRAMHGYYGNLFLSKFANGVLDSQGQDMGTTDAMKVWAYELRRFDGKTVLAAIDRCKSEHKEFPPSLPQFVDLCKAVAPRQVFKALPPAPVADSQAKRDALEKLHGLKARASAGGLQLLKQAIADAVRCGGGDEAKTLRRLDLALEQKVAS